MATRWTAAGHVTRPPNENIVNSLFFFLIRWIEFNDNQTLIKR